jgi:putative tryptophan/tyrosine transport system substrate-binding protein
MQRRAFLMALGATALSPVARAQNPKKVYRVGILTPGPADDPSRGRGAALKRALEGHGYRFGQTFVLEPRGALGRIDRLPALAQELAAAKVDVVVTVGFPTIVAAKNAGLPTVAASGVGDPVATGVIESLARPGGTVTGISDDAAVLSAKRLDFLKELLPSLRRVAMLWNTDDLGMTLRYRASAVAAEELGITVQALGVREPDDFNGAFEAMNREPPDAILMVTDSLTLLNRKRVFDYAAERRLPAIYEAQSFVRDGGLLSYGADEEELYERAAALVDRILKGAKPAELPFEQPTRYTLAINLKVAKQIGLTVPASFLARADEVIE